MPVQHITQRLELPPLHPIPQNHGYSDEEDDDRDENITFSSSLDPSPPDVVVISTKYDMALKANRQTPYRVLTGLERFKYTERLRKLSESSLIPKDIPDFGNLVSANKSFFTLPILIVPLF